MISMSSIFAIDTDSTRLFCQEKEHVELKHCKHCNEKHPATERYWFRNGGVFRKCKAQYSKYEADRHWTRGREREARARTGKHSKAKWELIDKLRAQGLQVDFEIKIGPRRRIDVLLMDKRVGIEVKKADQASQRCAAERQRRRYERMLPGFTVIVASPDGSVGLSFDQALELALSAESRPSMFTAKQVHEAVSRRESSVAARKRLSA
jgi:hypothetical protein